jgi:hypothetical protein
MENESNLMDARARAFMSLRPSFFFLFNNLKKKKKGRAQGGAADPEPKFVEKRRHFVELRGLSVDGIPIRINELERKCTAFHGFFVLCVSATAKNVCGPVGWSTPGWPSPAEGAGSQYRAFTS